MIGSTGEILDIGKCRSSLDLASGRARPSRRPSAGFGEDAQGEPVLEAGDVVSRALEAQALGARSASREARYDSAPWD